VPIAAEQVHERPRERRDEPRDEHPGPERQPQRLGGDRGGGLVLAGTVEARHAGGGAVGQEDRQRDDRRQDRRRERQRRELRRAQMTDDGGVGEQVQGLGRERPEGGQREA
jgi:hypothetical protein